MGTHVRYRVALETAEWDIHTGAKDVPAEAATARRATRNARADEPQRDGRMTVQLPPEHIWLVPGEDGE